MSRTTRSRSFLVAGFLGLAGLAASAATAEAQSTSPERALVNSIPTAGYGVVAGIQSPFAVDGERALLSRSIAVPGPATLAARSPGEARPVAGEQALLGAVPPSAQRRLTLAW